MADLALGIALERPSWLSHEIGADLTARLDAALNNKSHKERWKYTKTEPVLALVRSLVEVEIASVSGGLPATTEDIAIDVEVAPEACAAACIGGLAVIRIDQDGELELPETISPVCVRVGPGVQLELREDLACEDDQTRVVWLLLGEGAQVTHARRNDGAAALWQYLSVTLAADARYTLHNHSVGTELNRQDIHIVAEGPGADVEITSAALLPAGTHLDQQVTLEHRAPRCGSRQRFHNIVADGAKATFNGRIHIHPGAAGVAAHLNNRNVALGAGATINTKPELEIYCDDVACSHGATIGQIDDEALFYAASRGIPEDVARRLLSQAFLNEATTGPQAEVSRAAFSQRVA